MLLRHGNVVKAGIKGELAYIVCHHRSHMDVGYIGFIR